MANEYPWTNKHLFVDQSPLYNADKIHTPLLFVHGTADNNVPVGREYPALYSAETPWSSYGDGTGRWSGSSHHRLREAAEMAEYYLCLVCQVVAG